MKKIMLLICLIQLSISCGETGGKSSLSATNIFNKATNAFKEISQDVNGLTLRAVTCSSGAPTSTTRGSAQWAGELTYCVFNQNTKSPDSVQGSYYIISGLMCALEKQYDFQYLTDTTIKNGINILESDSCWGSGGFDANENGNTNDNIILNLSEKAIVGGDYNYQVDITLSSLGNASLKLYLKDSGGKHAAKIVSATFNYALEISIDGGEVSFENRDFNNKRHIRAFIKGDFSASGSFSNITSAKLIHAEKISSDAGRHSIIMGFDGSNEFYDHHFNGVQDSDYSSCSGSCSGLETSWSNNFHNFNSTNINAYDNSNLFDLSSFNMEF